MNSIQFTVLGEPYGKGRPRFNRFTGTAHTPEKTESREALVGYEYRRQCGSFRFPDTAMLDMRILAYYSVPKSDSKATRAAKLEGFIRPTKKPDMDNVVKLVADALNQVAYLVYFDIGTPREDIWHWFDERHSKGVVHLLCGGPFYEKDPDEVYPLREFVKQEVPFRLSEIFHIPDSELAPHIVDACIEDLCDNSDVMFDYDSIDAHIRGTLAQFGINPDDYEEEEENGKD